MITTTAYAATTDQLDLKINERIDAGEAASIRRDIERALIPPSSVPRSPMRYAAPGGRPGRGALERNR